MYYRLVGHSYFWRRLSSEGSQGREELTRRSMCFISCILLSRNIIPCRRVPGALMRKSTPQRNWRVRRSTTCIRIPLTLLHREKRREETRQRSSLPQSHQRFLWKGRPGTQFQEGRRYRVQEQRREWIYRGRVEQGHRMVPRRHGRGS